MQQIEIVVLMEFVLGEKKFQVLAGIDRIDVLDSRQVLQVEFHHADKILAEFVGG